MIQRTAQLEEATNIINASKLGKPKVLFINGPAGIGKSVFIDQLRTQTKGCYWIDTKAFESVTLPYSTVASGLRQAFRIEPALEKQLKLKSHLSILLPELELTPPKISDKATLLATIKEVFLTLAKTKPLVLCIEDIHWAGVATLNLIPQFFDFQQKASIILLASCRNKESNQDQNLNHLRNNLRRMGIFHPLNLDPFTSLQTKAFLEAKLGDKVQSSFLQIVHKHTLGLPFFLEEITNAIIEKKLLIKHSTGYEIKESSQLPLPDSVRDMIKVQIDALSENGKKTIELAAVLGQEFEMDILSQLSQDDQAIDELLLSRLIYEKIPGTGTFRHAIIRESLQKELLWSKRKRLNQQVATLLMKRNYPIELLAPIWLKAGERKKAKEAFLLAAKKMCKIHAYQDATSSALQAMELWNHGEEEEKRIEILQQLATCAQLSGQIQEAINALEEIINSPIGSSDLQKLGIAHRNLAICFTLQGNWNRCRQSHKVAAESFEQNQQWHDAATEWHTLANRCLDDLNLSEAFYASDKSIYCAKQAKQPHLEVKAIATKGYLLSISGKEKEGPAKASEAIALALKQNNQEALVYAYRKLAGSLEYTSQYQDSLQAYQKAINFCYAEKLPPQAIMCFSCMSWVLYRTGDWKKCLQVCKQVLEDDYLNMASKSTVLTITALIRIHRGEYKGASKILETASGLAKKENFKIMQLVQKWAFGLCSEWEGDIPKASEIYQQMIEDWMHTQDRHDILGGLTTAASFFAEQKQDRNLNKVIQSFSFITNETGNQEALAGLTYALGESNWVNKQYFQAKEHFHKAQQLFDNIDLPVQFIMATYKLGLVYQKLEKRADSQTAFELALQKAKALGMHPFIARIEAAQRLSSTTSTSKELVIHLKKEQIHLTKRQTEILEKLANGYSNKEIANLLYLSTRTVDMHVSNILDRMNCRSRTEAVKKAVKLEII